MGSLEEKYAALETVYKLGYALDALNYPDFAAVFLPDKKFVFDIYATLKKPSMEITPLENFNIATGSLGGFDSTQHIQSSPIVTIDESGKAHVKTMVYAFHAIMRENNVIDGMTVRVTWNFELVKEGGKWFVTKWVLGAVIPIDRPDLMQEAHDRASNGKVREGIVRP